VESLAVTSDKALALLVFGALVRAKLWTTWLRLISFGLASDFAKQFAPQSAPDRNAPKA